MIGKLQGLRSFVSVARWGSLRRAAHEQNYDISTLRTHIRELERRLRLDLLRRRPAGESPLTPEGEQLVPDAARAVRAVDAVEDRAAEIADET